MALPATHPGPRAPFEPATIDDLIALLRDASPVFVALATLPAALVAEAIDLDLVSEWEDSPAGPAVLLSSRATCHLGLELLDADGDSLARTRWVEAGSGFPSRRPSDREDLASVEAIDPAAGPLDALIAAEGPDVAGPGDDSPASPLRSTLRARREPPHPTILIGSGRVDWRPALERPGARDCRVCRCRRLSEVELCLGCGRSGIDPMLEPVRAHERPRPTSASQPTAMCRLAGGTGQRRSAS